MDTTDMREEMNARLASSDATVKQQLVQQRMETNSEFQLVRLDFAQLRSEFAQLRSEFSQVRADFTAMDERIERRFAQFESRIIRWVIGTWIAAIVLIVTLMTFALNNATQKQTAPPPPALPTVIVVPLG
ncbi:MAG TPA: hypothetical protein VFF16_17380 [Telluria sp.]|nr:hypothetical protein [Telluria sp.]